MNEQEKMYIRAALYALFKLASTGSVAFACTVNGERKTVELADAIEYFESLLGEEADNG